MQYEDKYLNRITSQHKIQPKYMAWLTALLEKLDDLAEVARQMDVSFDLDDAVGAQLDIIGQLVGVSRLLTFEPQNAPSALLSDEDYRLILRARISLNQWDGSTAGIYQLWDDIFPEATIEVVDNQDMSMAIRVYGFENQFASEYISHGYAAPKPQGVGINYEFIFSDTVSTTLYIGARPVDTRIRFNLSRKDLAGDFTITGEPGIGAVVSNTRIRFTLGRPTAPDEWAVTGLEYAASHTSTVRTSFDLITQQQ